MNLIQIFKALSDPNRLFIIQSLIEDEPGAERHCTSFQNIKRSWTDISGR